MLAGFDLSDNILYLSMYVVGMIIPRYRAKFTVMVAASARFNQRNRQIFFHLVSINTSIRHFIGNTDTAVVSLLKCFIFKIGKNRRDDFIGVSDYN